MQEILTTTSNRLLFVRCSVGTSGTTTRLRSGFVNRTIPRRKQPKRYGDITVLGTSGEDSVVSEEEDFRMTRRNRPKCGSHVTLLQMSAEESVDGNRNPETPRSRPKRGCDISIVDLVSPDLASKIPVRISPRRKQAKRRCDITLFDDETTSDSETTPDSKVPKITLSKHDSDVTLLDNVSSPKTNAVQEQNGIHRRKLPNQEMTIPIRKQPKRYGDVTLLGQGQGSLQGQGSPQRSVANREGMRLREGQGSPQRSVANREGMRLRRKQRKHYGEDTFLDDVISSLTEQETSQPTRRQPKRGGDVTPIKESSISDTAASDDSLISPTECSSPILVTDPTSSDPVTHYWIPSNDIMTSGLLPEDRDEILDGHWLGDRVIDASSQLIKAQYDAKGLQSCLLAASTHYFDKQLGEWIQIVNTTPKNGSHWVVLSTYGVDNSEVDIPVINIYDSLWTGNTSQSMLESIHAIVHSPPSLSRSIGKYDIRHMKCDVQPNSSDCGVQAIANVVSILQGTDPNTVRFLETDEMRGHLADCLERQEFLMFPSVEVNIEQEEEVVHTQSILNSPCYNNNNVLTRQVTTRKTRSSKSESDKRVIEEDSESLSDTIPNQDDTQCLSESDQDSESPNVLTRQVTRKTCSSKPESDTRVIDDDSESLSSDTISNQDDMQWDQSDTGTEATTKTRSSKPESGTCVIEDDSESLSDTIPIEDDTQSLSESGQSDSGTEATKYSLQIRLSPVKLPLNETKTTVLHTSESKIARCDDHNLSPETSFPGHLETGETKNDDKRTSLSRQLRHVNENCDEPDGKPVTKGIIPKRTFYSASKSSHQFDKTEQAEGKNENEYRLRRPPIRPVYTDSEDDDLIFVDHVRPSKKMVERPPMGKSLHLKLKLRSGTRSSLF